MLKNVTGSGVAKQSRGYEIGDCKSKNVNFCAVFKMSIFERHHTKFRNACNSLNVAMSLIAIFRSGP